MTTNETLGIDVGGVIIDRANDNTDTSFFSDNYLATTAVPGTFDAIKRLVEERFGERVHIVSKCGPNTARKPREWLAHHEIYRKTGLQPENVQFCRRRWEKGPICADLGVTHFIDDRMSVLLHLDTVPHRYFFQPSPEEMALYNRDATQAHVVESWEDVLARLLR